MHHTTFESAMVAATTLRSTTTPHGAPRHRQRDCPPARKLTATLALALVGLTLAAAASDYQFTQMAGQRGVGGWEEGRTNTCSFNNPNAMVRDASGNIYVADSLNHVLRRLSPDGTVQTLAGHHQPDDGTGHREDEPGDGWGGAAHFYYPAGLALKPGGIVVVADSWHHTLREVTPEGRVSTLAGVAGAYGSVDGFGGAARFNNPVGLATDSSGNVFVADRQNHTLRKVTPSGQVITIAGTPARSGREDGPAAGVRFNLPSGLAFDRYGNLFIADSGNSVIRKLAPTGKVSTFAGQPGLVGHADGPGPQAQFGSPVGLAFDGAGNLLVVDELTHVLRLITPAGRVSTVGGTASSGGSVDGVGQAAQFFSPHGLMVDADRSLLIADAGNHILRRGVLLPAAQLALTLEAGQPRLLIAGPVGGSVVVEFRTTLNDEADWQELAGCELLDGTGAVSDWQPLATRQRFYRLKPDR